MGFRQPYGKTRSSDGWPMVDEGSCTWVTVPGTNPTVNLEIQNGQPLAILRAWVADINAYVEHVNDNDTACWTETNKVADSNHLSGTAVDINWDSHPFEIADAGWNQMQIATIHEMLDWYEGTVFWGNDWDDPKDAMHFQLGSQANGGDIDTYGNPHTQDFINRKIRSDGFSTFRRSGQPAPPPVPTEMTVPLIANADGTWTSPSPAWAHLIMRESSGNPTIIQQITDVNSGGNEAEGLFQITPATWRGHNGTEFAPSARFATPQQQAIVAARIFTGNPSGGDWGAGLPGREDASQLAAGLVPTTTDIQVQGDDMAAVPQEQWDELFNSVCGLVKSQSPLRDLDEGPIWKPAQMWLNDDGMEHPKYVEWAASRGDQRNLARLRKLAAADPAKYPDRVEGIALSQQILARINNPTPTPTPAPAPAPVPYPTPTPAPVPVPDGKNHISPAGWIGIAGVVFQGLLWLLQQSLSILPPQWAAAVSGLLALMTALGIYKAPDNANTDTPVAPTPDQQPTALPPPIPAPEPQPEPPPEPQAEPKHELKPVEIAEPQEPQSGGGSLSDVLTRTQNDAEELQSKVNQINKDLK